MNGPVTRTGYFTTVQPEAKISHSVPT